MTPLPHSPFVDAACVDENRRFVLDENRFLQAVMEPTDKMPIFLSNPNPELYGIGPCMIHDLPMVRAENARTRERLVLTEIVRELGPIVAAIARR